MIVGKCELITLKGYKMIEAVNSTLSASSATRNVAAQNSTANSLSANPDKVQQVAQAPYVSPYIAIDRSSNRAVLQIRDSDTGDVVRQFPTQGQLDAYRTTQEFTTRSEQEAQQTTSAAPREDSTSVQTDA